MKSVFPVIARFANAIMDAINRKRKQDASDAPGEHIANGGRVQHSEKSFSDLADEPKRD
ncbi:hypothetical protein [Vibrio vulnificus YJ016]|uniref:Uncharacterized protein n=1 Tax=Vibrio vulnificus (strain YJ016) TaxID=196600 RepID=Q7ME35_VIBVY|nr:hypothetical protein [Vibrio vulnificus YJ016]